MTMDRSASGKRFWLLAVGVWACLSIAGCSSSGSAEDRGAGDVSPAATPATSATPASGGSSTPATTTSETTTTATPVPSDTVRTRKPSEVSIALLDTYAFVPGVRVVPTPTYNAGAGQPGSGSGAGPQMKSDNPKCAPFLAEANAAGNPGIADVTGYANITFQGEKDPGPFLTEEIMTVGTPEHVADLLASLDDSIHGCTKLTISPPSAKSSSMTVSAAPAPPQGDHPTAVHIVGSSGPLKGVHVTFVFTGVQDALITMIYIEESDSDIKDITQEAVERANEVFAKPA